MYIYKLTINSNVRHFPGLYRNYCNHCINSLRRQINFPTPHATCNVRDRPIEADFVYERNMENRVNNFFHFITGAAVLRWNALQMLLAWPSFDRVPPFIYATTANEQHLRPNRVDTINWGPHTPHQLHSYTLEGDQRYVPQMTQWSSALWKRCYGSRKIAK